MFTRHRHALPSHATYKPTPDPSLRLKNDCVTGYLPHRVFQHKNKLVPGFTSRYNLTRLVYYEEFVYPDTAINREKEIKAWRRSKKIRLIESMNPHWHDLAEKWTDVYKPEPTGNQYASSAPRQIPRSA